MKHNLMKVIIKFGFWGGFGGFIYSFISFCLFTSFVQNNLFLLFSFIIQGAVFGIVYAWLSSIFQMAGTNRIRISVRGALAGIISALPNILITLNNAFFVNKFYTNSDVRDEVVSAVILFSIGSVVAGIVVSNLITRE